MLGFKTQLDDRRVDIWGNDAPLVWRTARALSFIGMACASIIAGIAFILWVCG